MGEPPASIPMAGDRARWASECRAGTWPEPRPWPRAAGTEFLFATGGSRPSAQPCGGGKQEGLCKRPFLAPASAVLHSSRKLQITTGEAVFPLITYQALRLLHCFSSLVYLSMEGLPVVKGDVVRVGTWCTPHPL